MEIIQTQLVWEKLDALLDVLLDKEYFSFRENAVAYVRQLQEFIYTIPSQRRYHTKRKKYAPFTANTSPTETPPGI